MARSTRNMNGSMEKKGDAENDVRDVSPVPVKVKAANKKRKRISEVESPDVPLSKQYRSSEDNESISAVEEKVEPQDAPYPALAGDMPLLDEDAQKILDILDVADVQGLLDRVFPLDDVLGVESSTAASSSKTLSDSYSLRMLLKEPSKHPLRILKSAINQLYPISSLPRSKTSLVAQQQQRFCQLALSLISQASQHTLDGLSLSPELVFSEPRPRDEEELDVTNTRRKYALVQRLPTGDLWTSLNSDHVGSDAKPLLDAGTAHAELVAILPSASSSKPPPTLGELHSKTIQNRYKRPTSLKVSCGSFLDYGPYASFAPSFDSEGGDIGYHGVSSVYWRRHEKGKMREKARILSERLRTKLASQSSEDMDVDGVEEVNPAEMQEAEDEKLKANQEALLGELHGTEAAEAIVAALGTLEREENVTELLRSNGQALARLSQLQRERMRSAAAGNDIEESEINLAQNVMESLTLLASLRPRTADSDVSSLIPSTSILHNLQRKLPAEPSQGWYGTLSESSGLAVHDDTTLQIKNVAAGPVPNPPATPAAQNANFFANFPQNYRPSYSGQPNPTFQSLFGGQNISTPVSQKNQSAYPASFANHTPYASLFGNFLGSASQVGTPARVSTPQTPGAGIGANANYMAYVHTASPTPSRAVANTLLGKLNTAGGTSGPLALPPHMRSVQQNVTGGNPFAYGGFASPTPSTTTSST